MTKRQDLMEQLASLPEELLDDVQESLKDIVHFHQKRHHRASPAELAGIDRGIKAADAGQFASAEELRETLAGFRRG